MDGWKHIYARDLTFADNNLLTGRVRVNTRLFRFASDVRL